MRCEFESAAREPLQRRDTGFREATSFISSALLPSAIFYPPVRDALITGSPESPVNAMLLARTPFVETAWGAVRVPTTCPMNLRPSMSRFMSQLRGTINCILSRFDFLLATGAFVCVHAGVRLSGATKDDERNHGESRVTYK